MIPFVAVRKWGISDQHAGDFEEYRRRMWIAAAILIGFGWLTSIYFWSRFA